MVGPQIAAQLTPLASQAQQVSGSLAALNAPSKYHAPIASLVSSYSAIASQLTAMAGAERAHNKSALTADAYKVLAQAGNIKGVDANIASSLGLPTS
jgi:hypothetical protein